MTVNNPDLYNEAWDWAILDGCFGETKIKPTDIDGVTDGENGVHTIQGAVEHRGCFMWLETKRPGVALTKGQEILFKRLTYRGDLVLIIWGQKNIPKSTRVMWREYDRTFETSNLEHIREIASRWYQHIHNTGSDLPEPHTP